VKHLDRRLRFVLNQLQSFLGQGEILRLRASEKRLMLIVPSAIGINLTAMTFGNYVSVYSPQR
jgi:hypothetical protein